MKDDTTESRLPRTNGEKNFEARKKISDSVLTLPPKRCTLSVCAVRMASVMTPFTNGTASLVELILPKQSYCASWRKRTLACKDLSAS